MDLHKQRNMATIDKSSPEFLQALKDVEEFFLLMQFRQNSFLQKGYAYYVEFKRNDTIVLYFYGPGEYNLEMIVTTAKRKFSFGDLLTIPIIATWVSNNKYIDKYEKSLKNSFLYYIEILKIALPIIE